MGAGFVLYLGKRTRLQWTLGRVCLIQHYEKKAWTPKRVMIVQIFLPLFQRAKSKISLGRTNIGGKLKKSRGVHVYRYMYTGTNVYTRDR